jgi:DNA-binding GntR family transcriptional regulator
MLKALRAQARPRNGKVEAAQRVRLETAETQEREGSGSVVPPIGQEFHSLTQHVYTALLQAIADRKIKPGERLRLDSLAAQLKVSRTPIRDALSRLVAEGVVRPSGRRGLCVTRLAPEELIDLYDLRLMCELYALDKGFDEVTPNLLGTLEKWAAEVVRVSGSPNPSDRLAQSLADREFHVLLIGLARNPRLMELYDRLNIHIHAVRVGPSLLSTDQRRATNAKEHAAILAALRRRDLAAAKGALRRHITSARTRALESLKLEMANEPIRPATSRPEA